MDVLFDFSMSNIDTKMASKAGALAQEHLARAMAERGKKILDMEFVIEGTIEGSPWAKLADSTIKRKGHEAILYETGELMRGTYVKKTPKGWAFGVESTKFDPKLHEYGFFNVKSGSWVPARPMVGPAVRQVNREMNSIKSKIHAQFVEAIGDAFVKNSR